MNLIHRPLLVNSNIITKINLFILFVLANEFKETR